MTAAGVGHNVSSPGLQFGTDDPTTGDAKDERLADAVFKDFQNYVIGSVTVEEYDVVVTSPDPVRPNELEILHYNGSRLQHFVFENNTPSNHSSRQAGEGDARSNRKDSAWKDREFPHVAFSPSGVAEGNLVYAHYGRQTDFVVLQALGVDLRDSVVVMRMGRLTVAEKIRNCESHGVKAALLYWQDNDVTFDLPEGLNSSSFVPYASAAGHSIDTTRVWQPAIPCQTISADQASELFTLTFGLSPLNSSDLVLAPVQWQGSPQIPFVVGLRRENSTENDYTPKLRLSVYNIPRKKRIRNVINTIQGAQAPDHYVLVGSPRTSLPGQPQDTVVSTAILVQLARAFKHVHQLHSWLPRRGVKLVSWGGAELSSLGMLELIRKQHHLLGSRMVAYFDLKHLVAGNETILANIPASLNQLFNEVAFGVPNPSNGEQSLQMTWKNSIAATKRLPLGSSRGDSTYNPFMHILGIPTVHLQYAGPGGSISPPSLSTRLEQHHHFKFHLAVTRMLTLAMLTILDSRLLPFDLTDAAQSLHDTVWQTSQGLMECSQNVHRLGKDSE
ncbi:glutamate carboxypeptidase [Plakobranchus ocellatus]|uniref:Glutamate carboxypeptidase n=1 Tax=Plakobranchus ocellatus TaxID=259542 RepID=A0AAV4DY56_9GAST|nr:glutamate carboxypeptidase [Plakobranchus ocellatus]